MFKNIVIQNFSGTNFTIQFYLHSTRSIRKLIEAQGKNGLVLLKIFDYVETDGAKPFTNAKLDVLVQQYPRAAECNVAIQNVLENYTSDIAEGMVRFGVCNGFDAWRRVYHHYIPLSRDLQQILIQELYDRRPVGESEIDKFFNDIQRISELYSRAGSENIPEQWLVAAVKRHLLIKESTELSMELRKLNTVDEVQNAINIYRHDHRIGLPRGVPGTMLAMTERPPDAEHKPLGDRKKTMAQTLPQTNPATNPKQTKTQKIYMQPPKEERRVARDTDNAGNAGSGGTQGASALSTRHA